MVAVDVGSAAEPATGPWASAWTDPSAVDRLAVDCNYHPPSGDGDDADPLECATNLEPQSCTYNPCHEDVNIPCRRVCGSTCASCDATCRGTCGQCRAACHDDACVRACATSCGACLQSCLAAKDQCLTARCAERYQACARRSIEHFRQGPCLAACTRCATICEVPGRVPSTCYRRCVGRACTTEETRHCLFDGPEYGRPVEQPPPTDADADADAAAP